MHEFPDSLIERKCGREVARHAAALAGQVLQMGQPHDEDYLQALADFDFWLRADGNRRNPGTTADMIGASLFVCLRKGTISLPLNC
jgi:triphosphoribosyl-dephospho-CoA synthase